LPDGALGRALSRGRLEVLVDQRVRELPLRACELDPVALDGSGRRTGGAKLLPLQDEVGNPGRENVDGWAVPAAPETGSAQGSNCWAACHAPSIGTKTTKV
jgi:hypothetical protein